MGAHTPGTWRVLAQEADSTDPWTISANGSDLAEVFSRETNFGPKATHEEALANARLMAAAPKMLAALEEVVPFLEDREDAGHNGHVFIPNEAMRLLMEVRAAIAKATP